MSRPVLVLLLLALAQPAVADVRIAISEPVVRGADDPAALAALAEVVATELSRAPGVTVVTPADIQNLLGFEANRQLLGCETDDTGCLTEIGGALGVDYILGSRITRIGATWLVTLTLIDVAAARPVERAALETTEGELVRTAKAAAAQVREALRPEPARGGGGHGLRWVGVGTGGAAILAGGVLYGSAWATHATHLDGQVGDPRITWPEAQAAEDRAGLGVGLMAAGAVVALASAILLGPSAPEAAPALTVLPAPGGLVFTLELP